MKKENLSTRHICTCGLFLICLLMAMSIQGCGSSSDNNDPLAPIPGSDGELNITDTVQNYLAIRWTAATDSQTAQTDLLYRAYFSTSGNIDTKENVEANGTAINDWTQNLARLPVTTLQANTTYYFNILVKNASGGIAAYTMAHAATGNTPMAVTNGVVDAIVANASTLYIGGNFTKVGRPAPGIAMIDSTTGNIISGKYPTQINGPVYTSASDGKGGWYIGGRFSKVNGETRDCLARINSDGTLNEWNPFASEYSWITYINAIAVSGDTVYVGGQFRINNEQWEPIRIIIAAFDAETGALTSWNPNEGNNSEIGIIYSLTVSIDTVYIGGIFHLMGVKTRNNIAAADLTTGEVTSWNPNIGGEIRTIKVDSGTVYVGGHFSTVGGASRNYIAAIGAGTGMATRWKPNADGEVDTIEVQNSTVYVGGKFSAIGGQIRNSIAAIDKSTGLATSWNPGSVYSYQYVNSIAVNNDTVYAGGDFGLMNDQSRNQLAAIDIATGILTGWNPAANGSVRTISVNGNTIFAGGLFSLVGGQDRTYLASIDLETGNLTDWNPNPDSFVNSLVIFGNTLYAGGSFNYINNDIRHQIAAIDLNTGLNTDWNPGELDALNYPVNSIAVNGDIVYVGGRFYRIGGQDRNNIAAIDASTGSAMSWNSNADEAVYEILYQDGVVYACGSFTYIGGQARNTLAAIDANTGNATSWNPAPDNDVNTITISRDLLYAAGYFSNIGGQARERIAAVNLTDGNATSWNPGVDAGVYTLLTNGNNIYVGGEFHMIAGVFINNIAAVDLATGAATDWQPIEYGNDENSDYVWSLFINENTAYIGGGFHYIGSELRSYFAAVDIVTGEAR